MCEEWREDFSRFASDMGPCPPGFTLDRRNVHGDYTPTNCRWASVAQQANNKQDTVWVVMPDGRMLSLKQFSTEAGVGYKALHRRVRMLGEPLRAATLALLSRMPIPIPHWI